MRPKIATYSPGKTYRYAHLKRDGVWITLTHHTGALSCWTRHPTLKPELYRHETVRAFSEAAKRRNGNTTLYCELYAPGQQASQVSSLLAAARDATVGSEEDDVLSRLCLECFASPDLPEDAELTTVLEYSRRWGVPFVPYEEGDWPDWREHYDAEGLVYKDGNLLNWARHKDVLTCDLVCLGFTEGKLANLGYIGAIELGLADGTHVCNCGGMTHAERVDMTENEDRYIGRVCEVRYQRVESRGGLRHPRFVRWRDDKRPEECERP